MILSKSSLAVVGLTKDDKNIPVLNSVHVAEDGTVVASNGRAIVAVSPVPEKVKKALPLTEGKLVREVTLTSNMIKQLIRDIPRDTRFKGLLEFTDLRSSDNMGNMGHSVEAVVTDGKRTHVLQGNTYPRAYIDYKEIFGLAMKNAGEEGEGGDGQRVVVNLKRLLSLLTVIEKTCPDQVGELPVYIEFGLEGQILIRATNFKTGQDVVGVMTAYTGVEGKWKPVSKWERLLSIVKSATNRKKKKFLSGSR